MAFIENKEIDSSLNDLRNCQICLNPFSLEESCPRMLSCGHTFCHSCLQRFISEEKVCPTCKNDFNFISADDIPINFSVKCLSETLSKSKNSPKVIKDTSKPSAASTSTKNNSFVVKKVTKKKELPYEGHCKEHFSPNHFKCMNCNQYICGTCIYLFHKDCSKVLPVLKALNLMKGEKLKKMKVFGTKLETETKMLDLKLNHLNQKRKRLDQEIETVEAEVNEIKYKKQRNQKIHKDLSCHKENLQKATCNEDYEKANAKVKFFFEHNCVDILLPTSHSPSMLSKEDAIHLTRKDLEENTFYVMKSFQYAKVKVEENQISFGEWEEEAKGGSSCIDFLDFISSRTSVINTHKFIKEHKKELHNPKLPNDKIKFSKIEVKERQVYFHSFKALEESDFVIEFRNLLKTLRCSSVVPAEAFLKIKSSSGKLVVTTDGGSPRALNFLLLASGIMDNSYQASIFRFNDSFVEGGYNTNGHYWHLFSSVVEEIRNGTSYERHETKRGDIVGWNAKNPDKLSSFRVWKKDTSYHSISTFGRVKRGMEILDCKKKNDSIENCGLLLDLL